MSQRAFEAGIDALLHEQFLDIGMADVGTYTTPDASATEDCSVYVDRDTQTIGDVQQFKAGRVEVLYVLGSMTQVPRKNGKLVVDGDTYLNDSELSNKGSLSRWLVRRG